MKKPIEYISREQLETALDSAIECMRNMQSQMYRQSEINALLSVKTLIEKLPAAVAPVRKGMWLSWETEENVFECDQCHTPFQLMVGTPADNKYNYCPHCGAELHALYEHKEEAK